MTAPSVSPAVLEARQIVKVFDGTVALAGEISASTADVCMR